MIKNYVDLKKKFERKNKNCCDFHNAKYEFTCGRILNINKVNVNFVDSNKFLIDLNGKKNNSNRIICSYIIEQCK